MNLFFEFVIAVVVFIGIFLLIGALAGAVAFAGAGVLITVLKIALVVGGILWLIKFIQRVTAI